MALTKTHITSIKPLALFALAVGFSGFANVSAADTQGVIQLKDVQGKVMVNTGSGYVAGNSGMQLKPGYKVTLANKAQAKIVYANNCTQALKSNSLINVGSASDCQSKMFDEQAFTKNAAIGDPVLVSQTFNPFILGWSAVLGATALENNMQSNKSNQNPDASAN